MIRRRFGFGSAGWLAAIAMLLLPSARTSGQDAGSGVERFERTAEQIRRETNAQALKERPPGQRALIDYGGYLTFSYLSFDDQENHNHAFRGYDLVGYARVNLDDAHDFYLRGRLEYHDFNAGDSFRNESDHLEARVEEAYYRFNLAAYNATQSGQLNRDSNLVVQVGRQFQPWANGLVLSQYVDGGRVLIERGILSLELQAAVTAYDLTVDFDGSRPGFEEETRRAFYGALLSARLGAHRPFVYAMLQRDHNDEGPEAIGPIPTRFRYNSHYLGAGINGSLGDGVSYGAELVYEGGSTLSSSFNADTLRPASQESDDISAYAGEFHLDYLFGDTHRSRLGAGILFASGDADRGDSSNTFAGNRAGTTDTGFNALGFINDGLAFSPTFSNLIVLRGTASTYPLPSVEPFRQLQVGAEVFGFAKLRRSGAIDEPSENSRYLGWEPDLFLNWQVTEDVTLVMRYGVFFPGDALSSSEHRQFFYAGLTYAF